MKESKFSFEVPSTSCRTVAEHRLMGRRHIQKLSSRTRDSTTWPEYQHFSPSYTGQAGEGEASAST
ncbi:Hypothetical protein SMAX5B_003687 [Scophthalmus maximus]|uniref:Uncharacterized protein n=1 Tax=Scophthalmus maximus TaxID=52904 RepID=A0A2U9CF99_SCOMX|nr:Hypothetical protein SMAX5B_003687 [Scophthalmus maximus]